MYLTHTSRPGRSARRISACGARALLSERFGVGRQTPARPGAGLMDEETKGLSCLVHQHTLRRVFQRRIRCSNPCPWPFATVNKGVAVRACRAR